MDLLPFTILNYSSLGGLLAATAALLEALPWGVLVLDAQGLIQHLNRQAASWGGVAAGALVGQRLAAAPLPPALGAALQQLQPEAPPREVWLPTTQQWLGLRATPGPDGSQWIFWDNITARKQAETAQQRSSQLLLDMEAVAHTGTYEADLLSGSFYFSDGLYRLFGEAPRAFEVTLAAIDARSHPADVAPVQEALAEAVRTRQPYTYRRRICRPDGEWRTLEARGEVRCDAAGHAVQLRGLVQDVTERVQAEQAQRESHALLRRTIDSSLDLVQVFEAVRDEQGAVVDFTWVLNNNAAEQVYGDVLGQRLCQLNPGVVREGIFDTFRQVLETGVPDQREHHYVHEQFDGWFYQSTVKLGDGVTTTTHDISARKRLEQELRDSQALLQDIIDAPNIGLAVYRAVRNEAGDIVDFTHEYINRASREMLGEDFTGRLFTDHGENGRLQLAQLGEVLKTGHRNSYLREADFRGRRVWFAITNTPLDGDRLVHTWEDVTERQQAEAEIIRLKEEIAQQATDKYHALFRSMDQGFCVLEMLFDDAGQQAIGFKALEVNPRFAQESGMAAYAAGDTLPELVPALDEFWLATYGQVVRTGAAQRLERYEPRVKRWFSVHAFRLGPPAAHQVAVLFTDITARKRAEATLRESEAQFRTVANLVPDLLWRSTLGSDTTWYNEQWYAYTGQTPDTAAGYGWTDVIHPDDRAESARRYRAALARGQVLHQEHRIRSAQGEYRWFQVQARPLHNEQGAVTAWCGAATDIHARKLAELRLRRAAEADAFRVQFHEVLRPLADAAEIQEATAHLLREWLDAGWCYYNEFDDTGTVATVARDAVRPGLPSFVGVHDLSGVPDYLAYLRAGHVFNTADITAVDLFTPPVSERYQARGMRAAVGVPLVKEGRLLAVLVVADTVAREWSKDAVAMLKEVAEHTWVTVERARTEAALRQSEEKLRTVFDSIDEAFCLIDIVRDEMGAGVDYRLLEANGVFERQTSVANARGKLASEYVPGEEAFWLEQFDRVARTGEPARLENYHQATRHWYSAFAARIGSEGSNRVAIVFSDITERKQHEQRQAFLLHFSDALRAESTADAVALRALHLLSEQLWLDRCYTAEYRLEADHAAIPHQVGNDRVPPLPAGGIRLSDFPEALRITFDRTLVIDDVAETKGLSATDRRNIGAMGLRALVAATLRQGPHRPHWVIVAVSATPRHWTPSEIALLEDVTERTWAAMERAKIEEALRASEATLAAIFDALPVGIGLADAHGRLTLANHQMRRYLPTGIIPSRDAMQQRWYAERPDGSPLPLTEFPGARAQRGEKVVPGIEMLHTPADGPPVWTQVFAVPLQHRHDQVTGHVTVILDIDARKRAATALRAAAEAQTFRLQLADALGPLADAVAIQEAVTRLARQHFEADRCYYCEIEHGQAIIRRDAAAEGLPSVAGTYPLADFSLLQAVVEAGRPFIVRDVRADESVDHKLRQLCVQLQIISCLDVPVIKNRQPVGVLCLVQNIPREWTAAETALATEVAERAWVALERARTEEALAASEQRLRALIANLPGAAAFVVGPDLRYQLAGGEALGAAGLGPADLLGRTVAEAMPPALMARYEAHYRQALAGQHFSLEHTAHGRTFISRGVPLLDTAGRPEAVLVVSYDITARKQAEEALLVSETKYRTLFETMDQGFGIGQILPADEAAGTPLDWQWLEVNPQFERLTGLPRTDVLSQTTRRLLPGLAESWYERYALAATGETVNFEGYSPVLDRWFDVYAFALGPADNRRVAVLFSNISEQKQVEAALREAEAHYREQLEEQVAARTHELRESRDLLQSVFDTSLISMSVLKAVRDDTSAIQDFRLVLASQQLERETGRTDLEGKLYAEEYPGIRKVGVFDLAVRALETSEPQSLEYFYDHEGFSRWYTCQFVKLGDGLVATNLDITKRKTAEQERLKNLRLLEQAEAVAGLGSWDYDLATGAMHWSDGMYHLFDLPVGQPVEPTIYPRLAIAEDHLRAEQLLGWLTSGSGSFEATLRLRVAGQVKTVRLKAVVLSNEASQPVRVLGVDLDISELQRLEADNLRLRLGQQQTLFEAVQAAQEEERRRMSENLHNGVGQILYATKLQLDLLPNEAAFSPRHRAAELLSEAIRQTRALSHELTPAILEEFGLEATLRSMCSMLSTPALRWHCHLVIDDSLALPPSLQLAVYRLAQELAQNVLKHAYATAATLEVEVLPAWVVLRVEDNGRGFDLAQTSDGLGLRTLHSRAALLRGSVQVATAPGQGTQCQVRLPLPTPTTF